MKTLPQTNLFLALFFPFSLFAQPVVNVPAGFITSNTTWVNDSIYILDGGITVANGSTLHICPGTIIKVKKDTLAFLRIARGSKIMADGEAAPIVFTSAEPQPAPGDWMGLFLFGYAPENCDASPFGPDCIDFNSQIDTFSAFGDGSPDNNSGVLRYVRIEYAGGAGIESVDASFIDPALSLAGIGNGTVVDHLEIYKSDEVGIVWLGGTVNCSHLIVNQSGYEDFRFNRGYQGNLQFLYSIRDPIRATSGTSSMRFIDVSAIGIGVGLNTRPTLSNVTVAGPTGPNISPGYNRMINIWPRTQPGIFNSIFLGHFPNGLHLEGYTAEDYLQKDSIELKNTLMAGAMTPFSFPATLPPFLLQNWFFTPAFNNLLSGDPWIAGLMDPFNLLSPNPLLVSNSLAWDAASFVSSQRLQHPFFKPVNFIGAFGQDDWTYPWANWHHWSGNTVSCITTTNEEIPERFRLKIFPQPAQSETRLEIGWTGVFEQNLKFQITDVNGLIHSPPFQILPDIEHLVIELDTSGLPVGFYFVHLSVPHGEVTARLFVSR